MEFIKWQYQCDHLLVTQSICWSLNSRGGQTKLNLMYIDRVIYSIQIQYLRKKEAAFQVFLLQIDLKWAE